MVATNDFFVWFYTGLGGLGGWFLFFLLAVAAVVWLLYDSQKRQLPALGWRWAVILLAFLLLPVMIFRFSSAENQASLQSFMEVIFYLGLLGGVLPPVLDVGYYITFKGLTGCEKGHVYDTALGKCPTCASQQAQPVVVRSQPRPEPRRSEPVAAAPPAPSKQKASAWLVTSDGKSYQLNCGETTIGRQPVNDIQVIDSTISKQHAKIVEQNGHFRLVDLGSANGTRVNDTLIHKPLLLEPGDEICFGENTQVKFVTSLR